MNHVPLRIIYLILLGLGLSAAAFSQGADNSSPPGFGKEDKDASRGVKSMLFKMQVEKEKKEFREMLDRGEEAAKLTEQVERSFEARGALTSDDRQKIEEVGKLVKKIRSELGGSDDDDDADKPPSDVVGGVKYLRDSTARLLSELKNSSRFTISAAAIESSNAVLKVARFLGINK